MPGKLIVVVGGQFGSEAKGHVAGFLSREPSIGAAVRVAGPNAGHTVWSTDGKEYKLRSLPTAVVTNNTCDLLIAAGSEVDEDVLRDELNWTALYNSVGRLMVDGQATLMDDEYQRREIGIRTGTTGKGIGAARAARLMREAELASATSLRVRTGDTSHRIRNTLSLGKNVLIEGTQGYGLGLHAGYYPHCTSSDCRAIDFLGMAGVSPWEPCVRSLDVWVVLRSHPIRIAGNSGPLIGETTWDDLGVEKEWTTVTKKVRRVGAWDPDLAAEAVEANGGSRVSLALMFLDYVDPEVKGVTSRGDLTFDSWKFIHQVEEDTGAEVKLVGTGPSTLVDLRSSMN